MIVSVAHVIISRKRLKILYYEESGKQKTISIRTRFNSYKEYIECAFTLSNKLVNQQDRLPDILEEDIVSISLCCDYCKVKFKTKDKIMTYKFKYLNQEVKNLIEEGKRLTEAVVRDCSKGD